MHPLFGELLACSGFKRWNGVLLLVVELPDGSPGTVRADATNVFGAVPIVPTGLVLDGDGIQALHALVAGLRRPGFEVGANRFGPSLFAPTISGR
jgi:hypothetical protein